MMSDDEVRIISAELAKLSETFRVHFAVSTKTSAAMQEELKDLATLLRGNGRRGIVRTLENLETRLEVAEARHRDHAAETVKQSEFRPVRLLVYGAVGLMLAAVLGAGIALVLK